MPTIFNQRQENVVFPDIQVRRLTPIECERLQGFHDGYTAIPWKGKVAEDCPDGHRYRALGNSKAVPVIRWLGKRILQDCSEYHPERENGWEHWVRFLMG